MSDLPTYPRDASEREAAAVLETPPHDLASWGSRVAAYLLDVILVGIVPLVVLVALAIGLGADTDDGAAALVGLLYLALLVLPFVYFTVLHGGETGQTVGKRFVGIRVVDAEGRRLGYGSAFGRYAITFLFGLFLLPLLLDYLWPLWDRRNQALHDKVASSFVVRA